MLMNKWSLRKKLEDFLEEDIGSGDPSTAFLFDNGQIKRGAFIAKEGGIFAGSDILLEAYHLLDSEIKVECWKEDGEPLDRGDTIATITGNPIALLSGERVILNLIQRMCGIATITNQVVHELNNPAIQVCDTRKTTPGLRMLEKYAVTCGGGVNHRFGLYDGVMIKDNHIVAAGSIKKAIKQVREKLGHMMKIEVEVETERQLEEAILAKPDIIMLDNMEPALIKTLISKIPKSILTEASGNITIDNIRSYYDTGVDYISLGFITQSAKALDISFQMEEE